MRYCSAGRNGKNKMKNNIQPEEKEGRRLASFVISTNLLAELLHLPENHKIIGSQWDWASNSPRLFVEGPDLPIVPEGELISFITPTLTVKNNEDGTRDFTFNWNIDK